MQAKLPSLTGVFVFAIMIGICVIVQSVKKAQLWPVLANSCAVTTTRPIGPVNIQTFKSTRSKAASEFSCVFSV